MYQPLIDAIQDAREGTNQLRIVGHGSKQQWLPAPKALKNIQVEQQGIVDYQPEELVITAHAGTPLADLVAALDERNQQFGFEPVQFPKAPGADQSGTFGGMIGAGFSGPNRVWGGAVRDAVLGVEILNGRAELLRFGGQVMKNVAGYDVSRLLTASLGSLAVIVAASVRVQPKPQMQITVALEQDGEQALQTCRAISRHHYPLSGTWWYDNELYLRLSGNEAAVNDAKARLGGQETDFDWTAIRDQQHPLFNKQTLCRVIVPAATTWWTPANQQAGFEWAGELRWFSLEEDQMAEVAQWAQAAGGWMWVQGQQQPLNELQKKYMLAMKNAFDPDNVFCPHAMQLV